MTPRRRILLWSIILILLIPTLYFPLGADHFTFLRGGELVMNGGKMYVDYYDQKPPLIYYIFGVGGEIFGYTEIGLRIFDFLFQLILIGSLVYVVKKRIGSESIAYAIATVYAIGYTAMNASVTLQCESFAGLGIIWLLYFQTAISTKRSLDGANGIDKHRPSKTLMMVFFRGVCVGLVAGLKFPMGIVMLAVLVDDVLDVGFSPKILLKYWSMSLLGLVIMLGLAVFPFYDPVVWQGYLRMWEYIRFYTSLPAVNTEYLRFLFKGLSRFFGDNYSFLMLACIGVSIASLFRKDYRDNSARNHFIGLSFFLMVFLLISVVIERKLITYHFVRMYVPLSILSGYGVMLWGDWLMAHWRNFIASQRVIAVFVAGMFFVFSPLPRWINLSVVPYYYFFVPATYDGFFVTEGETASMRSDIKSISSLIRNDTSTGKTFAIATYASAIYYHLNARPFSKFTYSVWFFSKVNITGMRKEFFTEMYNAQWLVVEKDDHHPFLFGHSMSSWQCLQGDSEANAYVDGHFKLVKEATFFNVLKRIKPN